MVKRAKEKSIMKTIGLKIVLEDFYSNQYQIQRQILNWNQK